MTGNQVQMRGNSTMHTLILVDGKRMAAENTQSSKNAYELKRINISDVERIEIIRSNGSALYGSDAIGGVINIITKNLLLPASASTCTPVRRMKQQALCIPPASRAS